MLFLQKTAGQCIRYRNCLQVVPECTKLMSIVSLRRKSLVFSSHPKLCSHFPTRIPLLPQVHRTSGSQGFYCYLRWQSAAIVCPHLQPIPLEISITIWVAWMLSKRGIICYSGTQRREKNR